MCSSTCLCALFGCPIHGVAPEQKQVRAVGGPRWTANYQVRAKTMYIAKRPARFLSPNDKKISSAPISLSASSWLQELPALPKNWGAIPHISSLRRPPVRVNAGDAPPSPLCGEAVYDAILSRSPALAEPLFDIDSCNMGLYWCEPRSVVMLPFLESHAGLQFHRAA